MHIWKYGDNCNLLNIIKYILHLCEINFKIIQSKYFNFSKNLVHFYTKTYKAEGSFKISFLSPDQVHLLLIKKSTEYLCLLRLIFPPPDGFKITTIIKRWRYGGDGLAIKNNNHAPNRYSKSYLIKYNICKVYGSDSPCVMKYFPLSISTTAISWPEETIKPPLLHDKQIQTAPLSPQK